MESVQIAIIAISLLAIYLSLRVLMKRENFIQYPFSNIYPEDVNPFSPQSVYGQPGYYFGLATYPSDQAFGANKTLELVNQRHALYTAIRPDYKVNDGFNYGGNTMHTLNLYRIGAWENL